MGSEEPSENREGVPLQVGMREREGLLIFCCSLLGGIFLPPSMAGLCAYTTVSVGVRRSLF